MDGINRWLIVPLWGSDQPLELPVGIRTIVGRKAFPSLNNLHISRDQVVFELKPDAEGKLLVSMANLGKNSSRVISASRGKEARITTNSYCRVVPGDIVEFLYDHQGRYALKLIEVSANGSPMQYSSSLTRSVANFRQLSITRPVHPGVMLILELFSARNAAENIIRANSNASMEVPLVTHMELVHFLRQAGPTVQNILEAACRLADETNHSNEPGAFAHDCEYDALTSEERTARDYQFLRADENSETGLLRGANALNYGIVHLVHVFRSCRAGRPVKDLATRLSEALATNCPIQIHRVPQEHVLFLLESALHYLNPSLASIRLSPYLPQSARITILQSYLYATAADAAWHMLRYVVVTSRRFHERILSERTLDLNRIDEEQSPFHMPTIRAHLEKFDTSRLASQYIPHVLQRFQTYTERYIRGDILSDTNVHQAASICMAFQNAEMAQLYHSLLPLIDGYVLTAETKYPLSVTGASLQDCLRHPCFRPDVPACPLHTRLSLLSSTARDFPAKLLHLPIPTHPWFHQANPYSQPYPYPNQSHHTSATHTHTHLASALASASSSSSSSSSSSASVAAQGGIETPPVTPDAAANTPRSSTMYQPPAPETATPYPHPVPPLRLRNQRRRSRVNDLFLENTMHLSSDLSSEIQVQDLAEHPSPVRVTLPRSASAPLRSSAAAPDTPSTTHAHANTHANAHPCPESGIATKRKRAVLSHSSSGSTHSCSDVTSPHAPVHAAAAAASPRGPTASTRSQMSAPSSASSSPKNSVHAGLRAPVSGLGGIDPFAVRSRSQGSSPLREGEIASGSAGHFAAAANTTDHMKTPLKQEIGGQSDSNGHAPLADLHMVDLSALSMRDKKRRKPMPASSSCTPLSQASSQNPLRNSPLANVSPSSNSSPVLPLDSDLKMQEDKEEDVAADNAAAVPPLASSVLSQVQSSDNDNDNDNDNDMFSSASMCVDGDDDDELGLEPVEDYTSTATSTPGMSPGVSPPPPASIHSLPDALLTRILSYLPLWDLVPFLSVSKTWNRAIRSPEISSELCLDQLFRGTLAPSVRALHSIATQFDPKALSLSDCHWVTSGTLAILLNIPLGVVPVHPLPASMSALTLRTRPEQNIASYTLQINQELQAAQSVGGTTEGVSSVNTAQNTETNAVSNENDIPMHGFSTMPASTTYAPPSSENNLPDTSTSAPTSTTPSSTSPSVTIVRSKFPEARATRSSHSYLRYFLGEYSDAELQAHTLAREHLEHLRDSHPISTYIPDASEENLFDTTHSLRNAVHGDAMDTHDASGADNAPHPLLGMDDHWDSVDHHLPRHISAHHHPSHLPPLTPLKLDSPSSTVSNASPRDFSTTFGASCDTCLMLDKSFDKSTSSERISSSASATDDLVSPLPSTISNITTPVPSETPHIPATHQHHQQQQQHRARAVSDTTEAPFLPTGAALPPTPNLSLSALTAPSPLEPWWSLLPEALETAYSLSNLLSHTQHSRNGQPIVPPSARIVPANTLLLPVLDTANTPETDANLPEHLVPLHRSIRDRQVAERYRVRSGPNAAAIDGSHGHRISAVDIDENVDVFVLPRQSVSRLQSTRPTQPVPPSVPTVIPGCSNIHPLPFSLPSDQPFTDLPLQTQRDILSAYVLSTTTTQVPVPTLLGCDWVRDTHISSGSLSNLCEFMSQASVIRDRAIDDFHYSRGLPVTLPGQFAHATNAAYPPPPHSQLFAHGATIFRAFVEGALALRVLTDRFIANEAVWRRKLLALDAQNKRMRAQMQLPKELDELSPIAHLWISAYNALRNGETDTKSSAHSHSMSAFPDIDTYMHIDEKKEDHWVLPPGPLLLPNDSILSPPALGLLSGACLLDSPPLVLAEKSLQPIAEIRKDILAAKQVRSNVMGPSKLTVQYDPTQHRRFKRLLPSTLPDNVSTHVANHTNSHSDEHYRPHDHHHYLAHAKQLSTSPIPFPDSTSTLNSTLNSVKTSSSFRLMSLPHRKKVLALPPLLTPPSTNNNNNNNNNNNTTPSACIERYPPGAEICDTRTSALHQPKATSATTTRTHSVHRFLRSGSTRHPRTAWTWNAALFASAADKDDYSNASSIANLASMLGLPASPSTTHSTQETPSDLLHLHQHTNAAADCVFDVLALPGNIRAVAVAYAVAVADLFAMPLALQMELQQEWIKEYTAGEVATFRKELFSLVQGNQSDEKVVKESTSHAIDGIRVPQYACNPTVDTFLSTYALAFEIPQPPTKPLYPELVSVGVQHKPADLELENNLLTYTHPSARDLSFVVCKENSASGTNGMLPLSIVSNSNSNSDTDTENDTTWLLDKCPLGLFHSPSASAPPSPISSFPLWSYFQNLPLPYELDQETKQSTQSNDDQPNNNNNASPSNRLPPAAQKRAWRALQEALSPLHTPETQFREFVAQPTSLRSALPGVFASNLQKLDISGCGRLSPQNLALLLSYCPQLTHLSMARCRQVTPALLSHALPHLSNLMHLNLAYCAEVSDASLFALGTYCPRLTSLVLDGCHGLTPLAFHPGALFLKPRGIQSLSLRGCSSLNDAALLNIALYAPLLTSLDICGTNNITVPGIALFLINAPFLNNLRAELWSNSDISAPTAPGQAPTLPHLPGTTVPNVSVTSSLSHTGNASSLSDSTSPSSSPAPTPTPMVPNDASSSEALRNAGSHSTTHTTSYATSNTSPGHSSANNASNLALRAYRYISSVPGIIRYLSSALPTDHPLVTPLLWRVHYTSYFQTLQTKLFPGDAKPSQRLLHLIGEHIPNAIPFAHGLYRYYLHYFHTQNPFQWIDSPLAANAATNSTEYDTVKLPTPVVEGAPLFVPLEIAPRSNLTTHFRKTDTSLATNQTIA